MPKRESSRDGTRPAQSKKNIFNKFMSEELKKYKVLKAVAISGVRQPGEIVELPLAEAENIGTGEYLEEVTDESPKTPEGSEKSNEGDGDEED